jgi:hypothetical protein
MIRRSEVTSVRDRSFLLDRFLPMSGFSIQQLYKITTTKCKMWARRSSDNRVTSNCANSGERGIGAQNQIMSATPHHIRYFALPQVALVGTDLTTDGAWRTSSIKLPR